MNSIFPCNWPRMLLSFGLLANVGVMGAQAAESVAANVEPAKKPATAKATAGKSAAAKSPAAATVLVWRGDIAAARGLMNDLAAQYQREKKTRIEVNPFSTISGIDAVAAGSADFAGGLRPAHAKRVEENGIVFVPVAWDALVMIVSTANPVSDLSIKDLWRVYYGRADNWKSLGGNDAPINMYAVAGPLDGVEYALRSLVFRNGDQRVAAPRLYLNTAKLEEGITLDPNAMGVSTLSSVADNKKLKMLRIQGVEPSASTLADGSYSLYTPVYLAYKDDSRNVARVKDFIGWIDSPAAKTTLRKHALVPYSDGTTLLAGDAARLAMIETRVNETPVSAPAATAAALTRIAPTSPTTRAAKEREAKERNKKTKAVQADGKDN
ncbi:MAG: substrate-binding domain-containing protein [Tahibacter sp.]